MLRLYDCSKIQVETILYTDSTDGTDLFRFFYRETVSSVYSVYKKSLAIDFAAAMPASYICVSYSNYLGYDAR